MNESEFEAQLKADGYTEIETQNLDPRPGKPAQASLRGPWTRSLRYFYRHPDNAPVTFGPGQVFAVAHGELHDESIGENGARVLVGRKFSKTEPSAGL